MFFNKKSQKNNKVEKEKTYIPKLIRYKCSKCTRELLLNELDDTMLCNYCKRTV